MKIRATARINATPTTTARATTPKALDAYADLNRRHRIPDGWERVPTGGERIGHRRRLTTVTGTHRVPHLLSPERHFGRTDLCAATRVHVCTVVQEPEQVNRTPHRSSRRESPSRGRSWVRKGRLIRIRPHIKMDHTATGRPLFRSSTPARRDLGQRPSTCHVVPPNSHVSWIHRDHERLPGAVSSTCRLRTFR